ncbi:MAG: DUF2007 domain-containing protein [Pirellulaceae bacterium]
MTDIPVRKPDDELVTVYTVENASVAELVRNTLIDHGIECELAGEQQGGFPGTFAIEIIVKKSDAPKALEFIQIHHPNL